MSVINAIKERKCVFWVKCTNGCSGWLYNVSHDWFVPVWTEADAVHWATMSVQDLWLAGRLLIHDPLQHIVWLFVNQVQVLIEREEGKNDSCHREVWITSVLNRRSLSFPVPAADLTLRSFFGVTLHTRTVESAKPPAIRLESSVTSTAVRPCRSKRGNNIVYNKLSSLQDLLKGVNMVDTQWVAVVKSDRPGKRWEKCRSRWRGGYLVPGGSSWWPPSCTWSCPTCLNPSVLEEVFWTTRNKYH